MLLLVEKISAPKLFEFGHLGSQPVSGRFPPVGFVGEVTLQNLPKSAEALEDYHNVAVSKF